MNSVLGAADPSRGHGAPAFEPVTDISGQTATGDGSGETMPTPPKSGSNDDEDEDDDDSSEDGPFAEEDDSEHVEIG